MAPPLNEARESLEQATNDMRELTTQVQALVAAINDQQTHGVTHTVYHKSDGASIMVAICIACLLSTIGYIVMDNRSFAAVQRQMDANKKEMQDAVRDLNAWNDVNRTKIGKLEVQQAEKKP